MEVEVSTVALIQRPRSEVAQYSADPVNAPEWYVNILSAEQETPGPLKVGTRIRFTANFLRRTLTYTYEVIELVPERRVVMRTAEGPFPMETSYTWEDASGGMTRMTLRNRGTPTGFSKLLAPLIARSMKSANRKDLARLKQILEYRGYNKARARKS
ncbi:MAG: SRPBCC family protein [Gemmatimonadota bacterium]